MPALEIETGDDHQELSDLETTGGIRIRNHPLQVPDEISTIRSENERLKLEILDLKRHIQRMADNTNQNSKTLSSKGLPVLSEAISKQKDPSRTNPSIVVELPPTLRKAASTSSTHTMSSKTRLDKDHRSVSTTDERETVEPVLDIEAHQSAGGLHHRSTVVNATTFLPRTNDFRTDDQSNSSEENDPSAERRVLIPSPSHARDGILRANTSSAIANGETNNSNHHNAMTFWRSLTDRAGWLIGLLIFQSMSSFILARNESLLQHHAVIVQFLTMLVGAGGNAGNQASVGVVRGIAVGTIHRSNAKSVLAREFAMGVALSLILACAGCLRAKVFAVPWMETIAITASLFMIVVISVIVGATLPMAMHAVGIDPAHSSTTIQVVMDITGVVLTVNVCSLLLDSDFRDWLAVALSLEGETRH